jgi:hypothetical protein
MTENEIIIGVIIAAALFLGWIWWPKKEEEAKLDPVNPEPAPAPAPVKEEAPMAKATTKKAPAKKAPTKKAPAKKAPAKKAVKKGKK